VESLPAGQSFLTTAGEPLDSILGAGLEPEAVMEVRPGELAVGTTAEG
jgi:hypothetical protein